MTNNKVIYKIDKDGFIDWNEVKTINPTESIPEGYIGDPLPGDNEPSLYRPRWNGAEWVEDMSEEEIEEMYNKREPLTENEILMLAVAELDAQREQDKIETQLAIAELAEMLLGGED